MTRNAKMHPIVWGPIDLNLFWTLVKALDKPQAFYFRINKSGWFDLVFLWMWAYLPRLESHTAEGNDGVGEEVNGARRKRKKSQKGQNKITIGLPTFSNGVHESNHQVPIFWLSFRMTAPLIVGVVHHFSLSHIIDHFLSKHFRPKKTKFSKFSTHSDKFF